MTVADPGLVSKLGPAFEKYNEEQFATVRLPGSTQPIIVSSHSSLGNGRYYDVESSTSFEYDHATQVRILRLQIATPAMQRLPANINRTIAESQRSSELRIGGRTGGLNVGNSSVPIGITCLKINDVSGLSLMMEAGKQRLRACRPT